MTILVNIFTMTCLVVQLVEELSQELDDLRSFKAELMSNSRSHFPAEFLENHRKQLEAVVAHLKQVIVQPSSLLLC